MPKGIEYSAGGAAFGASSRRSIGVYIYILNIIKIKKKYGIKKIKSNPEILNKILKIAIPISIGTTVGSIMNLIDSIFVPQKLLEVGFKQMLCNYTICTAYRKSICY